MDAHRLCMGRAEREREPLTIAARDGPRVVTFVADGMKDPGPNDRPLEAPLEKRSEGDIVAFVHSKVLTVQQRRDFECARSGITREALVVLATQTLARAAVPRRGALPGVR